VQVVGPGVVRVRGVDAAEMSFVVARPAAGASGSTFSSRSRPGPSRARPDGARSGERITARIPSLLVWLAYAARVCVCVWNCDGATTAGAEAIERVVASFSKCLHRRRSSIISCFAACSAFAASAVASALFWLLERKMALSRRTTSLSLLTVSA
jgi:hypothetical protein